MTKLHQEGEIHFPDNIALISTTDPASHITYANQHFCDVAGYGAAEMEGVPHNLVRHPDMPKAAFADMWQRLRQGKSWMGLVKKPRQKRSVLLGKRLRHPDPQCAEGDRRVPVGAHQTRRQRCGLGRAALWPAAQRQGTSLAEPVSH